jgi:uncharacterized protein
VIALWVVASLAGALLGRVLTGPEDDAFASTAVTLGNDALPAAFGIAVAVAVTARLRWWQPVLRDARRAPAWAWVFVLGLAGAGALLVDWSRLSGSGATLLVTVGVTALLIAASEELVFRGVVLIALRGRYSEFWAALITAALFGIAHLLAGGFANIGQGVFTLIAGYLFYVTRRVTGFLIGAIILHGWWDVSVFSNDLGAGSGTAPLYFEAAVLLAVTFVAALVTFRWWQPRDRSPAS